MIVQENEDLKRQINEIQAKLAEKKQINMLQEIATTKSKDEDWIRYENRRLKTQNERLQARKQEERVETEEFLIMMFQEEEATESSGDEVLKDAMDDSEPDSEFSTDVSSMNSESKELQEPIDVEKLMEAMVTIRTNTKDLALEIIQKAMTYLIKLRDWEYEGFNKQVLIDTINKFHQTLKLEADPAGIRIFLIHGACQKSMFDKAEDFDTDTVYEYAENRFDLPRGDPHVVLTYNGSIIKRHSNLIDEFIWPWDVRTVKVTYVEKATEEIIKDRETVKTNALRAIRELLYLYDTTIKQEIRKSQDDEKSKTKQLNNG